MNNSDANSIASNALEQPVIDGQSCFPFWESKLPIPKNGGRNLTMDIGIIILTSNIIIVQHIIIYARNILFIIIWRHIGESGSVKPGTRKQLLLLVGGGAGAVVAACCWGEEWRCLFVTSVYYEGYRGHGHQQH